MKTQQDKLATWNTMQTKSRLQYAHKVRNKFSAIRQTYNGYSYMSKMEARHAALLDSLKKAKLKSERVVSVERQVKVPLVVNGELICSYYMDFVVTYADKRVEWVEVKGYETDLYKMKAKLFKALFPERIYVVVR